MTTTRPATHSLLSRRNAMTRLLAGGLLLGGAAWLTGWTAGALRMPSAWISAPGARTRRIRSGSAA